MSEDFHYDRMLAAKHDAEDAATAYGEAREEAVEEMVAALVAGREVRYGTITTAAGQRVPLTIDASDVKDEIDGEALRAGMLGQTTEQTAMGLWLDAARRLCERHVDEYLEWRADL